MKKDTYCSLMNFWQAHKTAARRFRFASSACSAIIFAIYPLTALYTALTVPNRLFLFLLIPALLFGFITLLRKILNLPRPYVVFQTEPLIGKPEKKGLSFPSRHTASAVIISCACLWISPILGCVVSLLAVFMALSRVLGGAHYPRDVLAAILLSLFAAIPYLFA